MGLVLDSQEPTRVTGPQLELDVDVFSWHTSTRWLGCIFKLMPLSNGDHFFSFNLESAKYSSSIDHEYPTSFKSTWILEFFIMKG
jgi:hypothetical protein